MFPLGLGIREPPTRKAVEQEIDQEGNWNRCQDYRAADLPPEADLDKSEYGNKPEAPVEYP